MVILYLKIYLSPKEYIQPQEENTEDHIPEEDIEDDGY